MYHWRDGWYFQRFENGDVEIKRIPPGKQGSGFGEGEADLGITIPAEEWVSIVHAMLPQNSIDHHIILALHHGDELSSIPDRPGPASEGSVVMAGLHPEFDPE